jgi:hypothetical protein
MSDSCKTYLDCESGICDINKVLQWPKPEDQNDWERAVVQHFKESGITVQQGASFGKCVYSLECCLDD